ncbi:MAG: SUMF1/EgtB/PvdO family nonheme iron enzyme [Bacteroidetes bacterium]|nr:SUMF1/EgtB/PvdO family nonheme iron enzyme [Bacteroidota bacterium]
MKTTLPVSILVLLFATNIFANRSNLLLPEPIQPLSKVAYPMEYYADQANLWQLETVKNTMNPDAWLNYFRAARYANILSRDGQPAFDLPAIVTSIPTALTNTFEYQFIRFLNANWDERRFEYLLKAHEIAPQRTEVYHDLVTYYETKGEQSQALFYLEKLFEAGDFPAELLAWNYNLLASVEPDAILLTYGDNDTYPLWVLQSARGIRKDVKVLNINLLLMDDYREKALKELGIAKVDLNPSEEYKEKCLKVLKQITASTVKPVYVANTMPEPLRQALGDSLYLTGLAFCYAPVAFDNLALLKNNYENRFLLDYLRVDFSPDSVSSVLSSMNLQYLPAFILLHQHYEASGEKFKAANLEPIMRRVAKEGGREAELENYLASYSKSSGVLESTISVRGLDKGLKKIHGAQGLYAFDTEVTNGQYEAFLMDLVKNRAYDLLETCKAPRTDWRSLLPEQYKNLPDSEVFKNANPDDPQAPIVNISHEAAEQYCAWITKVYNASNDKKKAFRKVRFRLPSEAEWELAAKAGRKDVPYPWGGYFIRNSKGCFLANYDVQKEEPCKDCPSANTGRPDDGGFFPVKVDSYFPNDFGLYNVSGNVAEMIDQPGVTKGGSWNEIPYYGQITSHNTYTSPQPFIGFRVFMEVVE